MRTLAGLSEAHIVSFMIDGLPNYLSSTFNALKPQSMDHFFEIASRAEAGNRNQHTIRKRSIERRTYSPPTKKRKPPNPCRICESKGFKNRFHWVNDCRNRDNLHADKKYPHTSIDKKTQPKILN